MAITITTPASSYRLTTVASLKNLMGITSVSDDALIGHIIDRVSSQIATFCNRNFCQETVTETLAQRDPRHMYLSRLPVTSVAYVKYKGDTVSSSEYVLQSPQAGFIFNEDGWEYTGSTFDYEARYTYGYVTPEMGGTRTLPYDIEQAALIAAKSEYLGRLRDSNIVKESVDGVYSVTYAGKVDSGKILTGLGSLPAESIGLLLPYRIFRTRGI